VRAYMYMIPKNCVCVCVTISLTH